MFLISVANLILLTTLLLKLRAHQKTKIKSQLFSTLILIILS